MKSRQRRICQTLLALAMVLSEPLSADEILLQDGSRVVGKLVNVGDGKIVFKTEFAGEISVDSNKITRLKSEDSATILMTDGSVAKNQRVTATQSELLLVDKSGQSATYSVDEISKINPEPWEIGEGYHWFGKALTALLIERGNSERDEFDINAESIWRSLADRYTLRGEWEVDKTDGVKSKDTWKVNGKYDRFLADSDNYVGALLSFESDEFADLDLRSTGGAYLGRQFLGRPVLSIQGELGVSYVDEQFDLADDQDHYGGIWNFELTSDIFGGSTTFYIRHNGNVDLTETDALILDTVIGIGMPIYRGLQADARFRYEYDGGAVEGVDESDQTYEFRIGYSW